MLSSFSKQAKKLFRSGIGLGSTAEEEGFC
jgi:hypothetical protein